MSTSRSVWRAVFAAVALLIGLGLGLVYGPRLTARRPLVAAGNAPGAAATPTPAEKPIVTALGRLRPGQGVVKVAGPSQLVVVVSHLLVKEGDRVRSGQIVALLDTHAGQVATVQRLKAAIDSQIAAKARTEAELRTAKSEYGRFENLHQNGTVSDSQRDSSKLQADTAQADLHRADAEISLARADLRRAEEDLELTVVRAPINGQVLKIHTRDGEKVGNDGIIELADNETMYAVAEVYETDVARVRVGQRATVKTPISDKILDGVVERIGLKIGKMDVLGTDPAAKTDARVVEVEVRLSDGSGVSAATNMQVAVSIDVAPHGASGGGQK